MLGFQLQMSFLHSSAPLPTTSKVCSPLRERTATTLCLNNLYQNSLMPAKGPLEPRAHNLPRRRKVSDNTIRKVSETTVKYAASPKVDLDHIVEHDGTCLQALVPDLFVAFADGEVQSQMHNTFTHIVEISSRRPMTVGKTIELLLDDETQKLHLIVPIDTNDDGQTILTSAQLLAVRNFLSQAMPRYYHLPHDPGEYPTVRILITTSNGRATDAVSAAACYLAFESGESVCKVLECINEEEDISETWRGVISGDGIDFVERIARK